VRRNQEKAMADSLAQYKSKRNFAVTPEPSGGGTPDPKKPQYVIQKHWASRLHYDLRLEIAGTMKSWAIPKGPSFDPDEKRMAVQVEDHPLAYNTFEGQIPANQYGAGRVILWDRGYWVADGDPSEGYRAGKLTFAIYGLKLHGRWALVRMRNRGTDKQPAWLLIKERDGLERAAHEFNVVDELPDSVASTQPMPPDDAKDTTQPTRASRKLAQQASLETQSTPLPQQMPPQLATLVDSPPQDMGQWIWELKFDGYRLLARVQHGTVRLFTRTGKDWTAKMPALASEIAKLPLQEGWIDGEVVVLDKHGLPDFQALQNAFDAHSTGVLVYYVFDLLYLDGEDCRPLALATRRQKLQHIVQGRPTDHIRFSESFEASPDALVSSACKLGFEGVVGKRADAAYVAHRSTQWIKLKCQHRQEFVIGGYTDPQGTRSGLGSLLLGVYASDGTLSYVGNVGTGLSETTLAQLTHTLQPLQTPQSPFADHRSVTKTVHWVKPTLVAEVSFADWTQDGKIRHAVFKGLRNDKPPQTVLHEKAQRMTEVPPTESHPTPAQQVSHPQRVVDETTGITKLDVVRYYARVAPLMLPHLQGRPVSLVRAPDGIRGELFFQKHWDMGHLDGVRQLSQKLYADHPPLLEISGPQGLISSAQMNCVEFHTWNAHKDRIARPDRMTFDLDPGEGVPWKEVQEGAALVRILLTELGLPAFLKTSGGKGLHVVVPLKRLYEWDVVKAFSQALVQHLAKTVPQRFVAKSGPKNRVGKIFVDYLRNGWGATTASAWTARARAGMGVSVPVAWEELESITSGAHWTLRNIEPRLKTGNGPWANYEKSSAALSKAMEALAHTR
jgi:bifunctional non-homologous end joining protein LigD